MARLSARSLRLRALAVTLTAAVAPVLFVAASDYSDRQVGSELSARVEHAAAAMAAGERDVEGLARAQAVWIRILGDSPREYDGAPPPGTPEAHGLRALRAWDADEPPPADRALVRAAAAAPRSRCDTVDGGRLLVCEAVVRTPEGPVLVMDGSRRAVRSFYDPRYELGRLTFFAVFLGLAVGAWLGWRMVKPIEAQLAEVLRRVDEGSAEPIPIDRDDEFGDLARAYNRLLARLEERRKANEAFAADLVHELKNPIAAVRTAAEILPGAADPERRERIDVILRDATRRMELLVRQFLELARAEAGLPQDPREKVDLRALIDAIVEPMEGASFTVSGSGWVRAAPERLEAALRNVLENAAAFGRRVEVRVDGGDVEIDDDGPGFSPEDLPRVFDRYFTRRRDGGTGLGLPLARAIIEAHGGKIVAANRPEGGGRLRIHIPSTSGR